MRYVLMTYVGEEHVAAWEASTAEEKQAEIDRVRRWFQLHGAAGRIVGGEELGAPTAARTVRRSGTTDGPFIETKEVLGGFIVVEVPDEATALEMARTWPGLTGEGDAVQVSPAGDSQAEADAQRA